MPALHDDGAATADVDTITVMVAPIAVAIAVAIATDADIDAAALATLAHPATIAAAIASALTAFASSLAPISLAPLASIPAATLATLGTGPLPTWWGLRLAAALSGRSTLSSGRSAPGGALALGIGILREGRAGAEQKPSGGEAKQSFLHGPFPRLMFE